eukprot:CAMPEP_0183735954 /NCGR_PEP_ID=MMETSP0737-20130205/48054_1 /TAXON_ID=385413 /ORGANISM="Thalassiosira miniscula, Strain CCMP1093" /LENGTH=351 /DNA_ID=CAMNT_0025969835 /DNA_START=79 /DNA_END=1131 /DNA_ORIENTATION=-
MKGHGKSSSMTSPTTRKDRVPSENPRGSNGSTNAKPVTTSAKMNTTSAISTKNKIRLLFFFFRFSIGSLLPFLSLYMTRIGLDATTIGKLQAIRPIITMCIAPMWGMVADRSGRKKMILLLTFVMSFISRMAIRYTIVSSNVQYFAMALCVTSIFYAPVPSLVDSMVISSLSEADKVNFGKLRLWGELGNGAASSIALRVINEYENNGFELAFLFHGISTVMALIFIVYCVPSSSNTNNTTNAIPTKTKKVVEEDDDDTVKTNNKTSQKQHHGGWKEAILFVFSNAQILSVFGLVAITGYSMGILENFCYINIRQLYADHGSMDAVGRDISIYRAFYTLGGTLTWFYSGYW